MTRFQRIVTGSALLTAAACVTRTSTVMNSWLGKSETDLVSSWGAPERSLNLTDGGKVLTWTKDREAAGIRFHCEYTFTVSPLGSVTRWNTAGQC